MYISIICFKFWLQWRIFDRLGKTGPSGWIANVTINLMRSVEPKDRPRGGGAQTSRERQAETPASEEVLTDYEDPNVSKSTLLLTD